MTPNPLQKYFRQPKLFLSLPSKGLYYKEGALEGDYTNVPIFAMTGMDEILMKTPDALFNGEATVKVIESCCPYIKDAHAIPSLDVDSLLVAIRIATFGDAMTISHTCPNCAAENDFDIDLKIIIDSYSTLAFDNVVQIDDLNINLKPLNYQQLTDFNLENFKMQRMLGQLSNADLTDEERTKHVDSIYENLADLQVNLIVSSIDSIRTPESLVSDKEFILEWIRNITAEQYGLIKTKLELNKQAWSMPKQTLKCDACSTEDTVEVTMDQSNFFVKT